VVDRARYDRALEPGSGRSRHIHVLSPRAIVGDIWTIATSSSLFVIMVAAKRPSKIVWRLFDRFSTVVVK
jgi:hypothetical protein